MDEMVTAIHRELIIRKDYLKDETVNTIYFGGGTPSLLSVAQLKLLLDTMHRGFKVSNDAEITLEANPDDLTEEKIIELKDAGINRLSIGIQSFFDEHLSLMNRAHNSVQARSSLRNAARHFDNITVDLIYGIPGLSDEQWKENLQIAFDSGIDHLSSYSLTVEPKTALASMIKKKTVPDVDDAQSSRQFQLLMALAGANDFEHYEISNFARGGKYSKHNTSYWQRKKYLGVGPSAHSFDGESRQWNVYNNQLYLRNLRTGVVPYEKEKLTKKDKYNEYILTGLRTMWGVDSGIVETEFGSAFLSHFNDQAEHFVNEGSLLRSGTKIILTQKGKFFADKIAAEFFYL